MLMPTNIIWLDLCLAGVGVYLVKQAFTKKNPAPYPPGPLGWPLIGNILDLPHTKSLAHIRRVGQEVLGQRIIVVNSLKTAMDMLDKKSILYSDRPVFPMGGELVGWKYTLGLVPYGDRFRRSRKHFRIIGSRAALDIYNPMEEVETHRFLKRVLANPDQLQAHIRHTAGAIILRISHGYEVKENDDPFVDLADRALDQFSQSTAPGAFMVDIMPLLAKVPEWFPGAGFKRTAREWRETAEEMAATPYKFVKDQMAAGIATKSFTSNLLEGRTLSAEEEHIVKWSAISMYGGGSDTAVSTIYSLFLAMTLFPDAQKKAQAEIDAVVGPDRLPSFADRDSLPYTEALAKEILRWNAVVPTGVPHRVTEDDIHDGYYIPKGSLIIPNIWFMLNDPRTYSNPSQFNPNASWRRMERNLRPNLARSPSALVDGMPNSQKATINKAVLLKLLPVDYTGLYLADASIWISTVMSLAVFDISKAVENGVEITPELEPSSGTIRYVAYLIVFGAGLDRHALSHPKPFKCSIKARSAKAIALIQQDDNY
ncbi:cytochrome P450 [Suillus ampliporus]|nr:cytochrome P450 [Suillus ampliporus]